MASEIRKAVQQWHRALKDATRTARKNSEIDAEADPEQISFELASFLVGTQWRRLLGDDEAFREARQRIVRRLGQLATEQIPESAFASLSAWREFLKKRDG